MSHAYLDATASTVDGPVTLRPDAYGVELEATEIGGSIIGQAGSEGFVRLIDSSVAGQLRSRAGAVLLDGSYVTGSVVADQTPYADVYDSFVDGDIRLTGNDPVAGVGAANLVRGDLIGEYDDVPPVDSMIRRPERTDRGVDLMDRAGERRSTALTDAAAAGDAGI